MTLAAVQGQTRAVQVLRSALQAGQVHHAWLFGGPVGVGKEATAVGLAQALLCNEAPSEGCGSCEVCVRVDRRLHPDVTWLLPGAEAVARGLVSKGEGTPSRELKVEQIRGLQERLSLRALEGKRKLAILIAADSMNESAQNALLKTLEEPPAETSIILLAAAPDRLLPTIRSRCARLAFAPLSTALIAEVIGRERKLAPEAALEVAALAAGSLGRARELDLDTVKSRSAIITRFEEVGRSVSRLLRFAEAHGGSRADAEEVLELLRVWNRDVGLASVGASGLVSADLASLAAEVAARLGPANLHRRGELLAQARHAIVERNASARLQLERLLIDLMGMA